MSQYGASQAELLSLIYSIGAGYLFCAALVSGQLVNGLTMCFNKGIVAFYVGSFIALGAFGAQFVYLLMKTFGSLITVMVTSTRKAFTVCLSFVVFRNKKFTLYHGLSICCIAAGIALNTLIKNRKARNSDEPEEGQRFLTEKRPDVDEKPLDGGFDTFDAEAPGEEA
jgi:adenosine 3'-phospho 5'-phosphosulfate transporter B3